MFPLANIVPVMHSTRYVSLCVCVCVCVCVCICAYVYEERVGKNINAYILTFFSAWTKSFEELNISTRLLKRLRKYFTLALRVPLYGYFFHAIMCKKLHTSSAGNL